MSQLQLIYTHPTDISELVPDAILKKVTQDEINGGTRPFVIQERLKASENVIESYLGTRYKLPLLASDGTVPPEIKDAVLVITKYKLYARRNAVNQSVQAEYDSVIEWLNRIAKGHIDLALPQLDGGHTDVSTGFNSGSTYGALF